MILKLKNELNDRVLRFDGVSEIDVEHLSKYLLLGVPPSMLRVSGVESDIAEFNTQVSEYDQIRTIVQEPISLDMSWQLPKSYQELDLQEYMAQVFEGKNFTDEAYIMQAIDRIALELQEVESRGMVEFMRTVIYILDQLKAKNVLWGVGRGSSCASYLLFLIGLHVVDCVKMDVSPEEFFHE